MFINKEITKEKQWLVKTPNTAEAKNAISAISSALGINRVLAALLYNRGYTDPSSARAFIRMENEVLRNPFEMADMEAGVKRIEQAVRSGEKITVYGDYDVDGVTSVCVLYLYLKSQGASVDYYIPSRSGEGYGVSNSAIDSIKKSGTSLIITVDTGITANEEISYAKSIGVDFVITDHHECRTDLPCAIAVINPHRPDCNYFFKELAGVGVVFKLICAYEEYRYKSDRLSATLKLIKEYADLVAIGTIADVMPIKEENRIIVKYGLNMIEQNTRIGLAALIDAASGKSDFAKNSRGDKPQRRKRNTKITSGYIGFTLAPRINAAGRVRSATIAVELFLSEKYCDALKIAEQLCAANKERQSEENKIMHQAYKMIECIDIDENPVIVLDANDWHHGVIGIVASRITEKYCRPSILVSFEGNTENINSDDAVGKGSGRSIKGLNLVDALCYCGDCLVKFGGHELAAGLSVTRGQLPAFKQKINQYAKKSLSESDFIPVIETDCEIAFSDINLPLAESLRLLEPYGVGNPVPLFVLNNINIIEMNGVSDGKHTKLILGNGLSTQSAIFFSNSPDSLGVSVGDKVDILFSIDINEWLDKKSVQLIIRDIRKSNMQEDIDERERARFEQIRSGDSFTKEENYLPERSDFVALYKYIQLSIHNGTDTFSHKDLCTKVSQSDPGVNLNRIKLKFMIMVFKELNIIDIEEQDEVYRFKIHYSAAKRDLSKSSILKRLKSQMR